MSKLGRPIKTERPEGWEKTIKEVFDGKLTENEAAVQLGISRQWMRIMMKRDFPEQMAKDRRIPHITEVGKSNRKYSTWLELHATDTELCYMISCSDGCEKFCPLYYNTCSVEKHCKGLISALLKKYPLKGAKNTLEKE